MNNDIRHILIIDDTPAIHEDFSSMLGAATPVAEEQSALATELFGGESIPQVPFRFQLHHAYQGEAALSVIADARATGIPLGTAFVDVRMPPGIDGIETVLRIWKRWPDMEIVICTAFADYSWEQILTTLGYSERLLFLRKPLDAVSVKQTALTLSTKWRLSFENYRYVRDLEIKVNDRTAELQTMVKRLSYLKEEAESATRMKSCFLATMSHEIRTPLNAILGFGKLLQSTKLNGEQEEFVNCISSNGSLLLTLVNDILDVTKFESGKLELETIAFDLPSLVKSSLDMMRSALGTKPVSLTAIIDPTCPIKLKGDQTRIRQILLNLLQNAIKFTSAGAIRVSIAPVLPLAEMSDEVMIQCQVSDTGVGIPAEQHARIFDTFTQVDSSITRQFGGSGLGLSIVKTLVDCMRGSISVTSKVGEGSTFTFTMVLGVQSPEIKPEYAMIEESSAQNLQGVRVLVIEDNLMNRTVMSRLLGLYGCVIVTADGGMAALEVVKREHFDIIFMDVQMPDIDGFETTRLMRQELGIVSPIIALTAHVAKADIAESLAAGMVDHLSKPFEMEDLLKKLRFWSGRETPTTVAA